MNRDTEALLTLAIGVCFTVATLSLLIFLAGASQPTTEAPPRPEFGTFPPDCGHLYNVDEHKEWAACMGVGYVPLTTNLQMKRNDV